MTFESNGLRGALCRAGQIVEGTTRYVRILSSTPSDGGRGNTSEYARRFKIPPVPMPGRCTGREAGFKSV